MNPQDIANAFSSYYESLYNLKDDQSTPQPSQELIQQFISKIQLATLTDARLKDLNYPFSHQEIVQDIQSLPTGKSPGTDDLLVL